MNRFTTSALVISLMALAVMSGCKSNKEKEAPKGPKGRPTPKIDAYIVTPSSLVNSITVSGSLVAFEEVELKNEVSGRVVMLNLPEGKFVKESTLLVKIFDDDLQANLRKLQNNLAIQEQIVKRQSELLKVNGISQTDFDQTSLTLNSLKSDIDVVKAQIRKTEVLAPFDGVIGLKKISPGAMVSAGTALATIRQQNKLKLDFNIPEKYGAMISPGLNIHFTVQGDTTLFVASVLATEQGIETATRNLKVRSVVQNNTQALIPGAYANVKLELGQNNNALLIPTNAIIPMERTKSIIVARKGKAHFVQVQTGTRTADAIEILSGVERGDTVITSGILFLKEGAKLDYASIKNGEL